MLEFNRNKLKAFLYSLQNSIEPKKLIILIGAKGIFLSAISHSKIIDNLFVANNLPDHITICLNFVQKFKQYQAYFLLDDNDCILRHELVPVLQSIVRVNPVERFINEHFAEYDIVAYNIYDVTDKNGEHWAAEIISTSYRSPLNELLTYVLQNSISFGGIYFLALECNNILDYININIIKESINQHKNLQIFVSITETSGIKFVLKHNDNIISVKNTEYPIDKPKAYAQGIIEQEITDCLIIRKKYINDLGLQTTLIFLVDSELKQLLEQSSFEVTKVYFVSSVDLPYISDMALTNSLYLDSILTSLFITKPEFIGRNILINSTMKLSLINKLIFKPAILCMFFLVSIIGYFQTTNFLHINKTESLNSEYNNLVLEYKAVNSRPELRNITNLMDLYILDKLLKVTKVTPYTVLDSVFTSLTGTKIELINIAWDSKQQKDFSMISSKQLWTLELSMKYVAKNSSITESLNEIFVYINDLRRRLGNLSVIYTRDTETISALSRSITIPISIYISEYLYGSK